MLKWVGIIFVAVLVYMIVAGNMGGAKKATGNYHKVMRGGK